MTTTYWSAEVETAEPEQIAQLQLRLLGDTLRACAQVPHYRAEFERLGIEPGDVRELSDLRELPFLDKSVLRSLQPWGIQAVPLREVARFNATTGTTGLPCNIGFTRGDLARIGELGARNLTAMGVRPDDIAWQCYGYGLWIGGSSLDRAYEQIGTTTFPAGPGRTSLAVERLRDLGVTVISCTPTFALLLVERAQEAGVDPRTDWRLRIGIFGGETMSPAATARLREAMPSGFQAHNTYGTTELGGPFVAGTCAYGAEQGAFHVWADHHVIEILDPATDEPITEPGVPGELVVTSLQREASPMLRWRTRDLTSWVPDSHDCPCGRRAHPKISWISGRTDDVLKVRGSLVMPSQVEDVVCATAGTGAGWQLVVDEDPDGLRATEATVVVEMAGGASPDAAATLEARLRDRLGIRLPVIAVGPGELPRYEGKARRVIDRAEFADVAPAAAVRLGTIRDRAADPVAR
ncbi:phenylacetate--CoA ligase family protein [Pseudonocardia thermophila]|uniref:phenylacetate--CoA ligase family protein n=1 Tax=Pseudonocardia thermophila TaxID=1848 RepID=UPI00093611BF|nr:AMP-binding protein [Pseudonocardia thermophila]